MWDWENVFKTIFSCTQFSYLIRLVICRSMSGIVMLWTITVQRSPIHFKPRFNFHIRIHISLRENFSDRIVPIRIHMHCMAPPYLCSWTLDIEPIEPVTTLRILYTCIEMKCMVENAVTEAVNVWMMFSKSQHAVFAPFCFRICFLVWLFVSFRARTKDDILIWI